MGGRVTQGGGVCQKFSTRGFMVDPLWPTLMDTSHFLTHFDTQMCNTKSLLNPFEPYCFLKSNYDLFFILILWKFESPNELANKIYYFQRLKVRELSRLQCYMNKVKLMCLNRCRSGWHEIDHATLQFQANFVELKNKIKQRITPRKSFLMIALRIISIRIPPFLTSTSEQTFCLETACFLTPAVTSLLAMTHRITLSVDRPEPEEDYLLGNDKLLVTDNHSKVVLLVVCQQLVAHQPSASQESGLSYD